LINLINEKTAKETASSFIEWFKKEQASQETGRTEDNFASGFANVLDTDSHMGKNREYLMTLALAAAFEKKSATLVIFNLGIAIGIEFAQAQFEIEKLKELEKLEV
jgi:hypothetical protein